MPFGTIGVRPSAAPKKTPPVVPAAQVSPEDRAGTASLRVLITAQTAVEAEDLACGMYFDMTEMTRGTPVSVFARDYETVNALVARKRELEALCGKPVGTVTARESAGTPLSDFTVTVGQAANQNLTLDLHIHCSGPSAGGADVTIALVRPGDPAPALAGPCSFLVADGFREKELTLEPSSRSAPRGETLERLCRDFEGPRDGGWFACAQVYGGLVFQGRAGGVPSFVTTLQCRGWMPEGCHIPIFTALEQLLPAQTGNIRALYAMIDESFTAREPYRYSWCARPEGGGR